MDNEHDKTAREPKKFKLLFKYVWAASYFVGIGVSISATVLVFIWLGMKADEAFGIAPKGTIAGIALGFPSAIYSIYYQVRAHFGKSAEDREKD